MLIHIINCVRRSPVMRVRFEMRVFKKELKAFKKQQNVNKPAEDEETFSFADAMQGVKPLSQDKVEPDRQVELFKKKQQLSIKNIKHSKQLAASFNFSDMYQASLPQEGPMRYCRSDVPTHVLKQLRRGDFSPEIHLDLHGLTREMAKEEIAALIYAARKDLIDCACIMHGFGQGVLKAALPHYLVQHPHVKAFHQAPLEYGGKAALLVLLEVPSISDKQ